MEGSGTNEAVTVDITGSGLERIHCLGNSFSKSGQDLTVDLSDRVKDFQINSLQYCSDQDEIHATVSKVFFQSYQLCCAVERLLLQVSSSSSTTSAIPRHTTRC